MNILITAIVGIISAIIGATISSITLYLLTKKNLLINSRQSSINEIAGIDKIFINHPDLYKYFYEGKDDFPDEETRTKAIAVSHSIMNHFANLLMSQKDFPDIFNEWVDITIAKRYGTSPILAETMVKFQDEYKITGKRQLELMQKGIVERQVTESYYADESHKTKIKGSQVAKLREKN